MCIFNFSDCFDGLVVKASTLRVGIGFKSQSSHVDDGKIGSLAVAQPDAWSYRVGTKTGGRAFSDW